MKIGYAGWASSSDQHPEDTTNKSLQWPRIIFFCFAGPLTDQSHTWKIPGEPTNSSLLATPMDFNEQPFTGIESQTQTEAVSPSAISNVVTEEPVVAVKDEVPILGSSDDKPTNDVVTTTRSPTTHFPSVVYVNPSEASGTVHELEPQIPSSDVPDTKDVPEPNSTIHHEGHITATPTTTAPKDVVPTHEVSEDGSGDPVRINSLGTLCREMALVVYSKLVLQERVVICQKQRLIILVVLVEGFR